MLSAGMSDHIASATSLEDQLARLPQPLARLEAYHYSVEIGVPLREHPDLHLQESPARDPGKWRKQAAEYLALATRFGAASRSLTQDH